MNKIIVTLKKVLPLLFFFVTLSQLASAADFRTNLGSGFNGPIYSNYTP